jgi:hypothetical protein
MSPESGNKWRCCRIGTIGRKLVLASPAVSD